MDFAKFYEVADRDLSIKCPRTLGMTFAQIGSTVSIVTNTHLRKFGYSSLIKTPIGVIDCKIPQGKRDLNFKIFQVNGFNQYSIQLNPLSSEDYNITAGRQLGPLKGLINYDSAAKDMNGTIGIENSSKDATFIFQGHYEYILDKMKFSPKIFDEFVFKIHNHEDFGFAFKYMFPNELLEYSAIYSFGFFSLGVVTQHPLKFTKSALKFSGYPAYLRALGRTDLNAVNLKLSVVADLIPNIKFSIRAEKEVPNPTVSTRFAVLADFQQQSDGEFGINLSGCATVFNEKWGSLAIKADTAGSVVCCLDPSFENMLVGHASIGFVPNRKGIYQTSYSFNISCFNDIDLRQRHFFETISDYFSVIKSNFQPKPQRPARFSFFK